MSTHVEELKELAQRACTIARRHGADAAEAVVQAGSELSCQVRLGEPELVQEASSKALGLRIFRDHRASLTYTSDFSPTALEAFVADAVELAKLSEPDELNELPDATLFDYPLPELDLFDPEAHRLSAGDALAMCKKAEAAARGYSETVTNSDGASFGRTIGAGAFANSAGFVGGTRGTYQSLTVQPICDDADGKKRSGHWWTASRFLSALDDAEAVGREAARRTVRKLGADKIDTGELPVVFDPEAGRALLRALAGVISGGAIYRKSSYLVGREGSPVASALCTIVDDPLLLRGPGSRAFDGDGLQTRRNLVVDGGVLQTYLLDTYSARKLGRASNGCAGRGVGGAPHVTTSNLILQKGATKAADVIKGITRGYTSPR